MTGARPWPHSGRVVPPDKQFRGLKAGASDQFGYHPRVESGRTFTSV
jgi:hypothetical protein